MFISENKFLVFKKGVIWVGRDQKSVHKLRKITMGRGEPEKGPK